MNYSTDKYTICFLSECSMNSSILTFLSENFKVIIEQKSQDFYFKNDKVLINKPQMKFDSIPAANIGIPQLYSNSFYTENNFYKALTLWYNNVCKYFCLSSSGFSTVFSLFTKHW